MNLLEQIQTAGIVGCGGAGFPTHVKLAAKGVETLIINAAECEPLLRTDRWLMIHKAPEMVAAVCRVKEQLGAPRAVIALKAAYTEEIAALEQAIAKAKAPVTLHKMGSFYPAGDEQVMVYEVTGKVVPPAGLPLDVGCVVSNAATLVEIENAAHGHPFTQKYLTVTGDVRSPSVIKAPVGTSFADCLELADGTQLHDYVVVAGGPMMGPVYTREQAENLYVTKTTSGFLVLPEQVRLREMAQAPVQHTRNRARSACIQCSYCTQLCPRWLLGHPLEPHKIMRRTAGTAPLEEQLDDPVLRTAQYCCECGVCELIACPMQLNPRRINQQIKQALAARGDWPIKGLLGLKPREYRAERAMPTSRAASRAGVSRWYHTEISRFAEARPLRVCIELNSHIGAPAIPLVRPGDQVKREQIIAQPPKDKLGVPYHASIDGTVEHIGAAICIRREDDE
jgi:Na+-translocating ferredoxin:NAD+ oxidoreductase RnfC subunit